MKEKQYTVEQEQIARFAKAMGHPARMAILAFLANQESCFFGDIHEVLPISKSTVSQHLKELKAGHSIEQPIYSFLTCTRSNETITVEPRDIVIVEGILILCNEELRNMMDMKVFVDADADDRLIRVINRDIIERGRTVEMVIERYERVLKPMHLQHIEPTKRYADIIIPQGGHNSVAIEIMTNFISHKLKG